MDNTGGAPLSGNSIAAYGALYTTHKNDLVGIRSSATAIANNSRSNTKRYTMTTFKCRQNSRWRQAPSGSSSASSRNSHPTSISHDKAPSAFKSSASSRLRESATWDLGKSGSYSLHPGKRKEVGEAEILEHNGRKKRKTSEKRCWYLSGRCCESDAIALFSYNGQDMGARNTTSGNEASRSLVPHALNEGDDENHDVGSLVQALVAMKHMGVTEGRVKREQLTTSDAQRADGDWHAMLTKVDNAGEHEEQAKTNCAVPGEDSGCLCVKKEAVAWKCCIGEMEKLTTHSCFAGTGDDKPIAVGAPICIGSDEASSTTHKSSQIGSADQFVQNYMRARKLARSAAAALAIVNNRRSSTKTRTTGMNQQNLHWHDPSRSNSAISVRTFNVSSASRDNAPSAFKSTALSSFGESVLSLDLGNNVNHSSCPISERHEAGEAEILVQNGRKRRKTSKKRRWLPSKLCCESNAVALSPYHCQVVCARNTTNQNDVQHSVPYALNERDDEIRDAGVLYASSFYAEV